MGPQRRALSKPAWGLVSEREWDALLHSVPRIRLGKAEYTSHFEWQSMDTTQLPSLSLHLGFTHPGCAAADPPGKTATMMAMEALQG